MRGLLCCLPVSLPTCRIIPARAGFTWHGRWHPQQVSDHPRACGVYPRKQSPRGTPSGSSPRVRGLPHSFTQRVTREGIIPARAGFTPAHARSTSPEWDHPRACGVYLAEQDMAEAVWGSSPRVRGLHGRRGRVGEHPRIIPARAGFTTSHAGPCRRQRDHPRACGVYVVDEDCLTLTGGSSPRVRGLPTMDPGRVRTARIIPARAGFTVYLSYWVCCWWDHPRACGVYVGGDALFGLGAGSSPRVRGLPHQDDDLLVLHGIIPARAGFTPSPTRSLSRARDHPRACGVYLAPPGLSSGDQGSSPRVRGLLVPKVDLMRGEGIIPARAGFTRDIVGDLAGMALDHPRACGVYEPGVNGRRHITGSSPRVRGLPKPLFGPAEIVRIIPARAGFTPDPQAQALTPRDHPRACGVYARVHPQIFRRLGSSPRVRGLPRRSAMIPFWGGIIPARAGFTPGPFASGSPGSDHPRACGVYSLRVLGAPWRGMLGSSPRVRGLPRRS